MNETKFVIVAPHVDDEVIGCFRFLHSRVVSKVFYLNECYGDRLYEAYACAKHFGFMPFFGANSLFRSPGEIILAPNIKDTHDDHKAANSLVKKTFGSNDVAYYSVDMNVAKRTLSPTVSAAKLEALKTLFPSQKSLFENDDKYHLFESVQKCDWLSSKTYTGRHFKLELTSYNSGCLEDLDGNGKLVSYLLASEFLTLDDKFIKILGLVSSIQHMSRIELTDTETNQKREFQIG